MSGQQLKMFSSYEREYLKEARRQAVRIALAEGQVSADRVHQIYPRPAFVSANICGAIFKDRTLFQWAGVKKSESRKRRAGMISVWKLTSRETGMAFLDVN
jgi:hypothetical protein